MMRPLALAVLAFFGSGLGCQPAPVDDRADGGRVDGGVILPDDDPRSIALNDCFAMCRKIADDEKDCPSTPSLKDCAMGCVFSARVHRCGTEFGAWTSCGRASVELTCDLEKREPTFVGCEQVRDAFRTCVGNVL